MVTGRISILAFISSFIFLLAVPVLYSPVAVADHITECTEKDLRDFSGEPPVVRLYDSTATEGDLAAPCKLAGGNYIVTIRELPNEGHEDTSSGSGSGGSAGGGSGSSGPSKVERTCSGGPGGPGANFTVGIDEYCPSGFTDSLTAGVNPVRTCSGGPSGSSSYTVDIREKCPFTDQGISGSGGFIFERVCEGPSTIRIDINQDCPGSHTDRGVTQTKETIGSSGGGSDGGGTDGNGKATGTEEGSPEDNEIATYTSTPLCGKDAEGNETCDCTGGGNLTADNCAIIRYVNIGIDALAALAAVAIIGGLVYSGFLYMTARDNPGQVAAARSKAVWAIVALMVLIFGYGVLNVLIPGGLLQ